MKEISVVKLREYNDGGTIEYEDSDGNHYFEDHRPKTDTKGFIFNKYPGEKDAEILEVVLKGNSWK